MWHYNELILPASVYCQWMMKKLEQFSSPSFVDFNGHFPSFLEVALLRSFLQDVLASVIASEAGDEKQWVKLGNERRTGSVGFVMGMMVTWTAHGC